MPTFTFKGFTDGSPVALSVAQGTRSVPKSVPTWGQGNLASVDILTVTAPVLTAPAGIWFEAIGISGFDVAGGPGPGETYDPSFHEITYVWTVRDQPLTDYTAPGNMPPAWRNANVAYGKKVVFFFPDPGTYTVDLWAVDRSGTTGVAEATVTIEDPDTYYAGTKTICFSNDPAETWADEKQGCLRATSMTDIAGALPGSGQPPRLLFKRGQEITDINIYLDTNVLGHVDTWGTGAKPVLRSSGSAMIRLWNDAAMDQLTIANIDFRGQWDAATETGVSSESPFIWALSPTACHYAVWNCDFDGFDHLDVEAANGLTSRMLLGNCKIGNWRNYGFLMRSSEARFALVGMQVAQHEDAFHGGPKTGTLNNNHGPLRIPECRNVYIGASDFFSRSGWSGLAGELADQPCLRLNTGGVAGSNYVLDRIVLEGGYHLVNMEGANTSVQENPGNYLIDKALFIATAKTIGPFVSAQFGGFTLRNAIGIMPNVPRKHPNTWQQAIDFGMSNPGPGNADAPIAIYSSTFLSLLDASNDPGWSWQAQSGIEVFTTYTLENNVLHAPDMITPVTGDGPISLATAVPGVAPRYKGVRYNFEPQTGSLLADVLDGQSISVPYSQITEDTIINTGTPATDQAYWQAYAGTDTRHMLHVDGKTLLAEQGSFTVAFGATEVTITNTSGLTWPLGKNWTLRLDRSSRLPPMDMAYATPAFLPLPVPDAGSPAIGAAGTGFSTRDDFLERTRGTPPSTGAVEPV